MDDISVAKALGALGHDVRLRLFRLLVCAGPKGLNTGEAGRILSLPASTLAHHLGALVAAGLVTQERQGRVVINRADYERLRGIFAFVEEGCCAGVATTHQSAA